METENEATAEQNQLFEGAQSQHHQEPDEMEKMEEMRVRSEQSARLALQQFQHNIIEDICGKHSPEAIGKNF